MTISIQAAVDRLIDARSNRRLLAPFSETDGDLSIEHAYAIQDALQAELDRPASYLHAARNKSMRPTLDHPDPERRKAADHPLEKVMSEDFDDVPSPVKFSDARRLVARTWLIGRRIEGNSAGMPGPSPYRRPS